MPLCQQVSKVCAVVIFSDTNTKRSKTAAVSFDYLPFSLVRPKSPTHAAAAQRQRYNDGHTSSSCLSASGHGVCVRCWNTAGDRATTAFSRSMQQSNGQIRTSHYRRYNKHTGTVEKQNQYKVAYITPGRCEIILNACVRILDLGRNRRIKSIPPRKEILCTSWRVAHDAYNQRLGHQLLGRVGQPSP